MSSRAPGVARRLAQGRVPVGRAHGFDEPDRAVGGLGRRTLEDGGPIRRTPLPGRPGG